MAVHDFVDHRRERRLALDVENGTDLKVAVTLRRRLEDTLDDSLPRRLADAAINGSDILFSLWSRPVYVTRRTGRFAAR